MRDAELTRIGVRVDAIHRDLYGNGQPGQLAVLHARVSDLREEGRGYSAGLIGELKADHGREFKELRGELKELRADMAMLNEKFWRLLLVMAGSGLLVGGGVIQALNLVVGG